MLDQREIRDLVESHGSAGFGESLVARDGKPIRLMFRNSRISTHDVNRGAIPFKDQVLAVNHDHMLSLVKEVLGTSQFEVRGLAASSTVIPAENLTLVMLENVLRSYMAESSTSTSLYQHWLTAREAGDEVMAYAGHELEVGKLVANGRLPYLMDTPSTKDLVDQTVDADYLVNAGVCTAMQYARIRNASLMAFGMVSHYLSQRGMVLVDTKTEHGPVSFSKEFARGMVTDQKAQQFSEEQASEIAVRYIEGLQHITGEAFQPDLRARDQRIVESVNISPPKSNVSWVLSSRPSQCCHHQRWFDRE